jgi:hypothetical protein
MDVKKYSLYDIFGFLREATFILRTPVQVDYEEDGRTKQEELRLDEYIAMTLADELTSDSSRMASDRTTSSQDDVIAAMKATGYDEVAFPLYGKFYGIVMEGRKGGNRSNRFQT